MQIDKISGKTRSRYAVMNGASFETQQIFATSSYNAMINSVTGIYTLIFKFITLGRTFRNTKIVITPSKC